jgi:hypothetical protein
MSTDIKIGIGVGLFLTCIVLWSLISYLRSTTAIKCPVCKYSSRRAVSELYKSTRARYLTNRTPDLFFEGMTCGCGANLYPVLASNRKYSAWVAEVIAEERNKEELKNRALEYNNKIKDALERHKKEIRSLRG